MPRKIRELKADLRRAGFMFRPGAGWMSEHHEHYSMLIEWSEEDNAYIVTVPELPGCQTHGATYEAAVRQGEDAIDSWIEACKARGNPVPRPRVFA